MFKCINCGCTFEEPKLYSDFQGYVGEEPAYEMYTGCPNCTGDFDDAFECQQCGEYFFEHEVYRGWCKGCVEYEFSEMGFDNKVDILEDFVYN